MASNGTLSALYAQSTTGGDESSSPQIIGGLEDVSKYGGSAMSAAKVKLIRDIARDMKNKFKVEGKGAFKVNINPDGDLSTLISQLKKAIPDPRTNGRTWSKSAPSQPL